MLFWRILSCKICRGESDTEHCVTSGVFCIEMPVGDDLVAVCEKNVQVTKLSRRHSEIREEEVTYC